MSAPSETTTSGRHAEPIAIIGLGCRFPGAPGVPAFWRLLRDGGDAIREVPPERWDVEAFYDPDLGALGKMNTRWGGILEHVDVFDPGFFGFSTREAASMDPQQRLLLEVAWEALEHAAIPPDRIAGSDAAVFVGIGNNDYSATCFHDVTRINAYFVTGNALCLTVNRLSHFLDLRGPSMALDTGCSSSLVAVHQACRSLRTGETDLALAGGVNLILAPHATVALSQTWMMAADGRCKSFDAAADGYVRGEGCGLVVLKRLADARRDGDRVLALIRGSAVNQSGHGKDITAPNGPAQQAVMRRALADAGVEPHEIDYLEAHGVGTPLADQTEALAIDAVVGQGREGRPCLLGSVKTNIGHLETAAGIAGLIKAVLALQNEEIPPHLHLAQLSPKLESIRDRVVIPTARRPWPRGEQPRHAGVNSFGLGGTNAHVVLAEAPASPAGDVQDGSSSLHLLPLSAKSAPALRALAGRYAEFLESATAPLADICFTAAIGRAHFPHRLAVLASDATALREQLAAFAQGAPPPPPDGRGDDSRATLSSLAERYTRGEAIDWAGVLGGHRRRRVELPTYPFQRVRCWLAPDKPWPRPAG